MGVLGVFVAKFAQLFVFIYETRLSTEYRMVYQKSVFLISTQNCWLERWQKGLYAGKQSWWINILLFITCRKQWPFVTRDISYSKTEITDNSVHHQKRLARECHLPQESRRKHRRENSNAFSGFFLETLIFLYAFAFHFLHGYNEILCYLCCFYLVTTSISTVLRKKKTAWGISRNGRNRK